ncbi:MAG: UDP-N-acetylmuramate--L-alanine ligase [Acidobacteria bacterium]|nr:UDP-N-acetylmuramate--L-alanine ligase [Acidobacteriota bacterium]
MAPPNLLGRVRAVHFVGIGGSGMSGLAELLLRRGYEVSGSDVAASEVTARLAGLGARVFQGHSAEHLGTAEAVVYSSAIRLENPERAEATRRRLPIVPRGEILAELMRFQYGIAVAGAHGKTTTASMIALVLTRAGLDPTAVIGARVDDLGSSVRVGEGPYFVAETDESDRSFLLLHPTIAVLTNIDVEHLDRYRDFADLESAFVDFASGTPFDGTVVACADDPKLEAVLARIPRRVVTYGLDDTAADFVGGDAKASGFSASCEVRHGGAALGRLHLAIPGRHNLQNAMAATTVGRELGIPFETIAEALAGFHGADRRFQVKGSAGGVLVVDDYGHHPTEIRAVLGSACAVLKERGKGRLIVAFQPHRYSRTRQLMDAFGPALHDADAVVLTDIYSAGEDPLADVSVDRLAATIRPQLKGTLHLARQLADVAPRVAEIARDGDLVLTLGAGSIGAVGDLILERLRKRSGI